MSQQNTNTKLSVAPDFLDAINFRPAHTAGPPSWVGHCQFVRWLLANKRPKTYVELGTHAGLSYFAVCQSVQELNLTTQCYAVDTWAGDSQAGLYSNAVFDAVENISNRRYAGFSRLLRMTFDDALAHFEDRSVDLLHIDGLHTYDAVKHDFETWLPKLADGAIVLFHDIAVKAEGFGVNNYWTELKKQYPFTFEFNHSNGLGVLQVLPINESSCALDLLKEDCDQEERAFFYESFKRVGESEYNKSLADYYLKQLQELRAEFENRTDWAISLDNEISEKNSRILELQGELEERTAWALSLDKALNEKSARILDLESELDRLKRKLNRSLFITI